MVSNEEWVASSYPVSLHLFKDVLHDFIPLRLKLGHHSLFDDSGLPLVLLKVTLSRCWRLELRTHIENGRSAKRLAAGSAMIAAFKDTCQEGGTGSANANSRNPLSSPVRKSCESLDDGGEREQEQRFLVGERCEERACRAEMVTSKSCGRKQNYIPHGEVDIA